ncbi:MAG: hypothetical protein KH437_08990 [Prevotella sp.]|nr:hypothetical protein [Prevotella sp.]
MVSGANNKVDIFIDTISILFLMLWSGGGFTYGLWPLWMIVLFPFLYILYKKRGCCLNKKIVIVTFMLTFIVLLQTLSFSGDFNTTTKYLLALYSVMIMSCYLFKSRHFVDLYIKIVFLISVISLVFWCIDFTPQGHNLLLDIGESLPQLGWDNMRETREGSTANKSYTLYVYTVYFIDDLLIPQNTGPFWEHGIFCIYLIIAFYLNAIRENKIITKYNIVFIIAIITSFSSTGYVVLIVALAFVILQRGGITFSKIFLLVMLLIGTYYISSLDFMTEKITENAMSTNESSRFFAMVYHWQQIVKSPFIGYGPYLERAFSNLVMSPNGWTQLLRVWGIPFSAYLLIAFFKGAGNFFREEDNSFFKRIGLFVIVMIAVFPQTLSVSYFYFFLYFYSLQNKRTKI